MTAVKKLEENKKFTYADYANWEGDWEVIGGKAYAMSPSPSRKHQLSAGKIHGELISYLKGKPCQVFYELDVVLSDEDIVRPDILVVCDKSKLKENNIQGAPDFIVEILSPSTSRMDKKDKLELYKKFGVKEYWIVDPLYKEITVNIFAEKIVEFYDLERAIVPVGIFGGELNIDLNYIFGE